MRSSKYIIFFNSLLFLIQIQFVLSQNNIPVVNTHVTSGLVMYVDAENDQSYNGSGLSWNDLSGNNNNGTISGASYDSDRKSFDFDGNDDKVNFPAVLSEGDDTYTIEAYFKADQNNKTQSYMGTKYISFNKP